MPVTVLIVDDEASVRGMLRDYLSQEGFRTLTAFNGREALATVRMERPDLVLLDMRMPGMDGREFLTAIRRESQVPVVVLTAQGEETDRIIGLELGADDYVSKPFSLREVKARVQAVLRRTTQSEAPELLRAGDLVVDRASREVLVAGRPVDLTPSEFELLTALMGALGRVFTRQDLLTRLANFDGSERTVDVHIRNLRAKLETNPAEPAYVETVFGVGYRIRAGTVKP